MRSATSATIPIIQNVLCSHMAGVGRLEGSSALQSIVKESRILAGSPVVNSLKYSPDLHRHQLFSGTLTLQCSRASHHTLALKAEANSGSGRVSAFKLNNNVVDAILPSMPATANQMGVLPCNMKEVDVVDIKSPYFEMAISSLYVRSRYYPPLWEEMKKNILSPPNTSPFNRRPMITIVIGQPGIGKSVGFGNYCVLRCMSDLPKTIIIVISVETVDVLFPPSKNNTGWQQYSVVTSALRSLSLELQILLRTMDVADHNALVVHDVKSAKGTTSLPYQDGFLGPLRELVTRVHMVILTSPQESNYGLAMKEGVPVTEKYLPVWSREELECTGSFDVQEKFEYCGGVPRSYESTVDYTQRKQAKASRAFDASRMRSAELSKQCSSVLVKLDIAPDFNSVIGLSPVSMSAERVLRTSNFNDLCHYFHDRVQGTRGTEKGLELEKWFMFWIKGSTDKAIECDIKSISDGKVTKLKLRSNACVQVKGNSFQGVLDAANEYDLNHKLNDKQSVLVQPKVSNFPVVDLLLFTKVNDGSTTWEVDAFQVTVSSSHAPPKASAEEFRKVFFDAGRCRLRHFVWVGLTAGANSADPNGGVTLAQKVDGVGPFFPDKQYRLDMAQAVPPKTI